MQIGFLMPNDAERQRISAQQAKVNAMRQDQRDYCAHLLASWRIFRLGGSMETVERAIKKTLSQKP
jgi:hypothetical protein